MAQQPTTKTELISLSQVKTNVENPRTITNEKFQKLINSILVFPKMMELRPVVINAQFVALGGNMRTNALNAIAKMQPSDIASRLEQLRDYQKLTSGEKDALKNYWGAWVKKPTVHAVTADTLSPTEQQQFIVKDNVSFGAWDFDALANKFDERDLGDWGMDIWQPTEFVSSPSAPVGSVPTQQPNYPADSEDDGGFKLDGGEATPQVQKFGQTLAERYIVPPFTVLDARSSAWGRRKAFWKEKIGNASETRDGDFGTVYNNIKFLGNKNINGNTSNFDPVLAEVMMTWFCPKGGSIIDPFGGEQTKGVVAGALGYDYHAVEFRQEQVVLNREKTKQYPNVHYTCGDSNNIKQLVEKRDFDLCFTSPPYYDLEVYSKEDMSALGTYEEFMAQYENIFRQCYEMLADDAFLVIKIGEIRDKKTGIYRNFLGDNITIFKRIGFKYYNELVLLTPLGLAAVTVNSLMRKRKVRKVHQNVLVFLKGDVEKLMQRMPSLEFDYESLGLNAEAEADTEEGIEENE